MGAGLPTVVRNKTNYNGVDNNLDLEDSVGKLIKIN